MPEESPVEAWLDLPATRREIKKAASRLSKMKSTLDPVAFVLMLDLLQALEFIGEPPEDPPLPDHPPDGFFDPDDDPPEPWRGGKAA
jgi:hypothetical protein